METNFEFLRAYQVILVAGPQRSGTTFAAHVIAGELKRRYVDEQDVKGDPRKRLKQLLRLPHPVVVQCPGWTYLCHLLGGEQTAVVLVRRPLEEIVASQERIGWTRICEAGELARYGAAQGPVAQVKYDFWEQHQRELLGAHGFEIDYGSLKNHPMWVPEQQRESFEGKQIAPGEGNIRPQGLLEEE